MIAEPLTRKDEICEAVVDYVFQNGVSDISLRPLAKHLGTSPRMLLYHFASKEQLLADVLAAARARQYTMLRAWAGEGATLPELLRRYWAWASHEEARPYMRSFFEVFGLSLQERPGTEGVLTDISSQPIAFFQPATEAAGLDAASANQLVRLAVAVLRGLLFDLLATNDRAPLDAAFERFVALVESTLISERN